MSSPVFPEMRLVRQKFPKSAALDIEREVQGQLERTIREIKGAKVAVAVGSRGISNLSRIVGSTIQFLKTKGAEPYIIPAMGSHGGATPEGQISLLAEYGVTEKAFGVPIAASMDVECIGKTEDGVDVFCSNEALRADGAVVINRVKPHTDFRGTLGSGILKMLVIGLGKRAGAANFHILASRFGYEHVIRTSSRVTSRRLKLLCGLALLEDQRHDTARIVAIPPNDLEARETELFHESSRLMPKLPFDEIDLLIIDQIGKNISGAGMDPNVIGRGVHGYTSMLSDRSTSPVIRRIFVRGLTPETHGNAIGIGSADFTTDRLVAGIDQRVTAINALTALTVQSGKVPIHFVTDWEAIDRALDTLALQDRNLAKVMRIRDTLSLETLEISESFLRGGSGNGLELVGAPAPMSFGADGNLKPLRC
jgi:hypothetical protein